MKNLPPLDLLLKLLSYDPHTGVLTWKPRHGKAFFNAQYAGMSAGHRAGRYYAINILGEIYQAHRIIWLLSKGVEPTHEIDHINGNPLDNRLNNLRDVRAEINMRNLRLRSDNTTGAPGVYQNKRTGRWYAQCCHGDKNKHLGYFDSYDAAYRARRAFQSSNGYHANHGRAA